MSSMNDNQKQSAIPTIVECISAIIFRNSGCERGKTTDPFKLTL